MNFSLVVPVICAIWVLSEILLAVFRRSGRTQSPLDKSSLRIIWATIILAVPGGVYVGKQSIGHISPGESVLPWIGLLLILSGIGIRWWAVVSLGKYFTVDVAIRDDHKVVKSGLYRHVRHPIYAGSLLSFFGLGLTFPNILSILIIFVPICAAFVYRITVEEQALIETFGDEYINYCKTTKRLIPGVY